MRRGLRTTLAITCALTVALTALSGAPRALAHSGDVLSAWAIVEPTIDGEISPGEWADADTADFTLAYCSESHDVTLFVKNDDTYLYLAAVVRDEEYSDLAEMYHDFANFYFDNDNDGVTDVGEDGLAIRFDNSIFRDTYNPTGVNGWSYSDDSDGGSNDILGATSHTNPVPDGVGDYTFEYRHQLDSADDAHDFSLAAGDTVGFRFSFPDGEADCQPVGYDWPSSSPTRYGDIVIASEAYVSFLFVPLNWTNTQEAFDSQVDTQIGFFVDAIPLSACPERVAVVTLDVATQNLDGFGLPCTTEAVRAHVINLGINPADYDVVVGLVEHAPCGGWAGESNEVDTVWVETVFDSVTAHEIGHIYSLEDEYCSNQAGSRDERCNDGGVPADYDRNGVTPPPDKNPLDAEHVAYPCDCPPDGSNDSGGTPCCNIPGWPDCTTENYGICCRGNLTSAGGVAIMSFADAELFFPGPRGFDEHSRAHLATIPVLSCSSPEGPLSGPLIDVNLELLPDGTVAEDRITLRYGRPTRYYQQGGEYEMTVLDKGGKVIWSQSFDIRFDYNGPVYKGVDYSELRFSSFPFAYRIPFSQGMHKLVLRYKDEVTFSKALDFCNSDGRCGTTETNLTCPQDCPPGENDGMCATRNDGTCDPDCLPGVDPDCQGECGNNVCNLGEHHGSCPHDCGSGRADGYCDGKEDARCDPDCGDEDPDCRSRCGDGECSSCTNTVDLYACENHGNCAVDCPSGEEDHHCDGKNDGVCDPDCSRGEDRDCGGLPSGPWIIVIGALLVLLVILALERLVLRRKQPRQH